MSQPDRLVDISRAEEGKAFPYNFTTSYPYVASDEPEARRRWNGRSAEAGRVD